MDDQSFQHDAEGLAKALALMNDAVMHEKINLPESLPTTGLGEGAVLDILAPTVLGGAQRLGAETAFAHMDPPTPWITWAMTLWNASLNQNLLHPDVAPIARELETRVVDWLAPLFGMDGGHMTPGSSVSNITALWAAREITGARRVVASSAAHLSVAKTANLLGLDHRIAPVDLQGKIDVSGIDDLDRSIVVLTAGTTNTGAIDPLELTGRAAWTHVDAAWCGPMRLSDTYQDCLDGIEQADSVAVSAHKWLFQPKDSALVFFRDTATAHSAVTFGGSYLAAPNVGMLGSHGAAAVPLLATLLSFGRDGIAARIDRTMASVEHVRDFLTSQGADIHPASANGVLLWRLPGKATASLSAGLPAGSASQTTVDGIDWMRQVAANPNFDAKLYCSILDRVFCQMARTD